MEVVNAGQFWLIMIIDNDEIVKSCCHFLSTNQLINELIIKVLFIYKKCFWTIIAFSSLFIFCYHTIIDSF